MTRKRAKAYEDACTKARILYIQEGGGHLALMRIIEQMDTQDLSKRKIYGILTNGGRTINSICQNDELVRAWSASSTDGSADISV